MNQRAINTICYFHATINSRGAMKEIIAAKFLVGYICASNKIFAVLRKNIKRKTSGPISPDMLMACVRLAE